MGCAKSFLMICFDFPRCIGSALYFLDLELTLYKSQRAYKHLSSSMVVSDPTCDTFQDLDDEMAEDDGDEEDDFWLGKLKDFISPCQPIFRKGIKSVDLC